MGTPITDTRDWPLCRVLVPREAVSVAELEAHLLTIGELFSRNERFALLIDARVGVPPSARERRTVGLKMADWHRRYPNRLVGMAVVLSSALQRGVLTAIQWASGDSVPSRAFAAAEPAEAWLRAALLAANAPAREPRAF